MNASIIMDWGAEIKPYLPSSYAYSVIKSSKLYELGESTGIVSQLSSNSTISHSPNSKMSNEWGCISSFESFQSHSNLNSLYSTRSELYLTKKTSCKNGVLGVKIKSEESDGGLIPPSYLLEVK